MRSPVLSWRRFAKTPGPPSVALTCPRRTAGPSSPGVGEPLYHPAGAPGPSGGTSTEPSSLRPRLSSSDSMPAVGTLTEIGSDAGRTFNAAGAGDADGAAVCVAADDWTGDAGVAVAAAGAATDCTEALVAQPVRSSTATAADPNWHLRRALIELVIRRVVSIPQLCADGGAAAYDHRPGNCCDCEATKCKEFHAVLCRLDSAGLGTAYGHLGHLRRNLVAHYRSRSDIWGSAARAGTLTCDPVVVPVEPRRVPRCSRRDIDVSRRRCCVAVREGKGRCVCRGGCHH